MYIYIKCLLLIILYNVSNTYEYADAPTRKNEQRDGGQKHKKGKPRDTQQMAAG